MKTRFFLISFILPIFSLAQNFLGYGHSNYAGIVGASYNPASLADNNYSMDILLCGGGIEVGNNYVGVKRSSLDANFGPQDMFLRERNTKKAAFVRGEILLPGIMFSNGKTGWGIDLKIRTYANVEGISRDLAHIFAFELKDPLHYEHTLYNRHLGVTALSWMEIGGTYAKTIWTGAEHFVAAGVRPKFLLGLGGMYAFIKDAGYNFRDDSTLSIARATADFGISDNFTFDASGQPSWRFGFNPGLGMDAGIIYEFRPDVMQKDEKEKKKEKPWPGFRQRPAYKYRVGISLTDLGIIHFHHGEFSDKYALESNLWDYNEQVFNPTSPEPLFSLFKLRSHGSKEGTGMWMRLPLALNLQYDYLVTENFYVNAVAFSGIYLRNNDGKKVHELTRMSITPRWEKRWYGVWMPVSFSRLGNLTVGTGFRFGPFVLGTTNVLPLLFKNKTTYTADVYFALKVPLFPAGKIRKKKVKLNTDGKVDDCPK
jgi:hypothetical protein